MPCFTRKFKHIVLIGFYTTVEEKIQTADKTITRCKYYSVSNPSVEALKECLENIKSKTRQFNNELNSLGLFKGKQKKHLKAELEELAFISPLINKKITLVTELNDLQKQIKVLEEKISTSKAESSPISEKEFMTSAKWLTERKSCEPVKVFLSECNDVTSTYAKMQYAKLNVGNTITLGKYDGSSISWRILTKEEERILVVCEPVIAFISYHDNDKGIDWKNCNLRGYLNGSFLKNTFSKEEQNIICSSKIKTDNIETVDSVFLLSEDEARNYFKTDKDRATKTSSQAESHRYLINNVSYPKAASWWLRSSSRDEEYLDYKVNAAVTARGDFYALGADEKLVGLRPAVWIDITW